MFNSPSLYKCMQVTPVKTNFRIIRTYFNALLVFLLINESLLQFYSSFLADSNKIVTNFYISCSTKLVNF